MTRTVLILLLAASLAGCSTTYVPMVLSPAELAEPAECTRDLPKLPRRKIGPEGLSFATFARDWRTAKAIIDRAAADKAICKAHFAAKKSKAGA